MELKIRIKETIEERRALTREEYFAVCICNGDCPIGTTRAGTFLRDESGYVNGTFKSKPIWGVGTFKTETIRDATSEEKHAWHYLRAFETDSMGTVCGPCMTNARERLKDKEIILELI